MRGLAVTWKGNQQRLPGQVLLLQELFWKKNQRVCARQTVMRHGSENNVSSLWHQNDIITQQYSLPLWAVVRPVNRQNIPPSESVAVKMLRDVILHAHQEAHQILINRTLPFSVRGITVLNLGYIITAWPSYHSQQYIWPVGYRSVRFFISFRDPSQTVSYTLMICDGGPSVGELGVSY